VNSLKPYIEEKHEADINNWYIDQITIHRKKYFLFTNSKSLFSFIKYFGTQKEIKNLKNIFSNSYKEEITRNFGYTEKLYSLIDDNLEEFEFSKTNSRSILGSMNDFKLNAKARINRDGFDLEILNSINYYTNKMPMGFLKYKTPFEIHQNEMNIM